MNWKLVMQIFWIFTKVAMFSWGGGPASMALMQRETTAAGWVTPDEFADGLAISNALPGPIGPQVAAYVGYKIAGTTGAISAAMGTVVPTTVLMLVMVIVFFGVKDSPAVKAMLQSVRPLIIGLLLWTTYDMAMTIFNVKKLGLGAALIGGWDKVLIVAASFLILTFTKISPIWLVLAAAVLGFFVYR
jgi:chromate transporter